MSESKKESNIFTKAFELSSAWMDSQIAKAKSDILDKESTPEDKDPESPGMEMVYPKAIVDDPNYRINGLGFKEKPYRLMDEFLKQMALKSTVVAAIIQTRQNQVARHSQLVNSSHEKGFRIVLKDEKKALKEIKDEITKKKSEGKEQSPDMTAEDNVQEKYDFELERKAKAELRDKYQERIEKVQDFIINSGIDKDKPFESKKWDFEACLRAWTRDSLTFDRVCAEMVPDQAGKPHHYIPVDASTIKLAAIDVNRYKASMTDEMTMDYQYPEAQVKYLENHTDAIQLDMEKVENEEYKYVQVVTGLKRRFYTPEEMKVGMRNPTTDIYANGYSISELELLVSLITSHLNTEYYNKSYYTQGFSAKGILHIKAPINRRKLETIRQQWHSMVRGSKNSFQTPIFAGTDDVKWLPLTQSHSEMEFQGWLNYLVKMICSIYQIDPKEIGMGMRDEGGKGGGMGSNDTQEKLDYSMDKGLKPLMNFFQTYLNKNIVQYLDPDLKLIFTGIDDDSTKEILERQEKEVKFKKTVNEIRAEDDLPPLPGMDDYILESNYTQWYNQFSETAIAKQKQDQEQQMQQQQQEQQAMGQEQQNPEAQAANQEVNNSTDQQIGGMFGEGQEPAPEAQQPPAEPVQKSISIEYYTLK